MKLVDKYFAKLDKVSIDVLLSNVQIYFNPGAITL